MSNTSKFEKVILRLLRPVLKLCLRNSIKLNEIVELMKKEMVTLAKEEIEKSGDKASGSKISVMTGVHRKDISRLEKSSSSEEPKNLISKIMVQWQHASKFITKAGEPRVLNTIGRHSEFAKLVESVNGGDISSYSVLSEMERVGIVKRVGNRVRLVWRDYAPRLDKEDALNLLASDSEDLFSAVEQNIYKKGGDLNLHLKTVFDKISEDSLPEIRTWLLEEGSLFHKKVRNYLSQFDADLNHKIDSENANCKVSLGSFSLTEVFSKGIKG